MAKHEEGRWHAIGLLLLEMNNICHLPASEEQKHPIQYQHPTEAALPKNNSIKKI
jgi:hypothetical protein